MKNDAKSSNTMAKGLSASIKKINDICAADAARDILLRLADLEMTLKTPHRSTVTPAAIDNQVDDTIDDAGDDAGDDAVPVSVPVDDAVPV